MGTGGKGRQEEDGNGRERQTRRGWERDGKAEKKKMERVGNSEDKNLVTDISD
jgi:hypothetical protein